MEEQNLSESVQNRAAPVPLPTSMLAVVSLIAGIVGFTFMPVIGCIVALLTGYAARREIRGMPPTASGDGMATAGIIMGWIQVALGMIGMCCIMVVLLGTLVAIISANGN